MNNPYGININRNKTRRIFVGDVPVGGDSPISVQTMTNTDTRDTKSTIEQVLNIQNAGADIVRISCPDQDSSMALKEIIDKTSIPVVADIHFHYKRAIEAANAGASCLRINPGNIGSIDRVKEVVKAAKDNNCSIRIGVNGGSLEKKIIEKYKGPTPRAMVESALFHENILRDLDFDNFKISVKTSNVLLTVESYKELSKATDAPLHLGITEAGGLMDGTIKSSIGIGQLLTQGIGDTLRVSLSADPVEEVKVGFSILKSLGIRQKGINIISCPSCARQGFDVINTVAKLEKRLSHVSEPFTISIIGCVVNGPGEATMSDVGFTGGGNESGMLYVDGKQLAKKDNDELIDSIVSEVEKKIKKK
tara:strand:+ start:1040 stop:2128 length:1089 start_codon:yes stop_codon:yes gene_type:complete